MTKTLRIAGTRGIPARHGGFETFAERLAVHLVGRDWRVVVYCQRDDLRSSASSRPVEGEWRGVRLVQLPSWRPGALGSVVFDWRTTLHAAREPGLILTLGYNTAVFGLWYRLRGRCNIINMDGVEWKRSKWSPPVRAWFWVNETIACRVGQHLIADHDGIRRRLLRQVAAHRVSTIAYGADAVEAADPAPLAAHGLSPGCYALVVSRPEPENSLLEIVSAFSRRPRGMRLAVVGVDARSSRVFDRKLIRAASDEVRFVGPIYEQRDLQALRFHARLHLHGHTVGGTNPSLVEALGAGSAVLAHDNEFNRGVAGPRAAYFVDEPQCAAQLDHLLDDDESLRRMRDASRERFGQEFTWDRILTAYERCLDAWWSRAHAG